MGATKASTIRHMICMDVLAGELKEAKVVWTQVQVVPCPAHTTDITGVLQSMACKAVSWLPSAIHKEEEAMQWPHSHLMSNNNEEKLGGQQKR